ncbi:hypothetical protein T492DRAFT_907847 [Pavlovales sp. CCMP2436]|nr:hypothetical protein T492DRAFT_907847 [Pavlovales sp. CCMP2436]
MRDAAARLLLASAAMRGAQSMQIAIGIAAASCAEILSKQHDVGTSELKSDSEGGMLPLRHTGAHRAPSLTLTMLRLGSLASVARAIRQRGRRLLATSIVAPTPQRTFLGASLGLTASAITLSVFVWPIADLLVAPRLIRCAVNERASRPRAAGIDESCPSLGSAASSVHILSGGTPEQRSAIARALADGRPAIYLSDLLAGPTVSAPVGIVAALVFVTVRAVRVRKGVLGPVCRAAGAP